MGDLAVALFARFNVNGSWKDIPLLGFVGIEK